MCNNRFASHFARLVALSAEARKGKDDKTGFARCSIIKRRCDFKTHFNGDHFHRLEWKPADCEVQIVYRAFVSLTSATTWTCIAKLGLFYGRKGNIDKMGDFMSSAFDMNLRQSSHAVPNLNGCEFRSTRYLHWHEIKPSDDSPFQPTRVCPRFISV